MWSMERFTRGSVLALLLLLGWTAWVGGQPPPISLSVSPWVSFEPSTLVLTLHIPRDPLNRSIDLILEGDDYYSASSFEHLPSAPSLLILTRPDVPSGEYVAVAFLHRSNGKTIRSVAPSISVLERY